MFISIYFQLRMQRSLLLLNDSSVKVTLFLLLLQSRAAYPAKSHKKTRNKHVCRRL